jgi:hypothetical protein
MSVIKLKMEFSLGGVVATEDYYSPELDLTSGTNTKSFAIAANQLIAARSRCLFKAHDWIAVQLTPQDGNHAGWLLGPGENGWPDDNANVIIVPKTGDLPVSDLIRPEMMQVSGLMIVTYDGGRRRSRRYFTGLPDAVTKYNPQTIDTDAVGAWWQRFRAFTALLCGGYWRLLALDKAGLAANVPVRRLILEAAAPTRVGVVVNAADLAGTIAAGDKIHLLKFRPKRGLCPCPSINGNWTVDDVSTTLLPLQVVLYLRGSQGVIDPSIWDTLGQMYVKAETYFNFISANIYKAATHKRGNGSRPRGRSKTRCCVR